MPSFAEPFVWLDYASSVGDFKQQRVADPSHPRLSVARYGRAHAARRIVATHGPEDPTGTSYTDVRHTGAAMTRLAGGCHLGNGLGTIRFETFNAQEPSGVRLQYAQGFERFTPDLRRCRGTTVRRHHVAMALQDFLTAPDRRRGRTTCAAGRDRRTRSHPAATGDDRGRSLRFGRRRRGAIRGRLGVQIPIARAAYRLSGSLWRVSPEDNVYLD